MNYYSRHEFGRETKIHKALPLLQTAVPAYFSSKQVLPFAFALYFHETLAYFSNKHTKKQTAVIVYFTCMQLLLFAFEIQLT